MLKRLSLVVAIAAAMLIPCLAPHALAQAPVNSPTKLRDALAAKSTSADADRLAEDLRNWFGRDAIRRAPGIRTEGLMLAFAIEAPGAAAPPRVVAADGHELPLTKIGNTDVYAATATVPDATAARFYYDVGGVHVGGGQFEVYRGEPENMADPAVPKGKLIHMPKWQSTVFAGTSRDWSIYVPAQYTDDKPACVMVFQDGGGYAGFVPTVFDNLIAKGDMPVTAAIFIDPGTFADGRSDRSFEYDTLSDQYTHFIMDEILPEVEKTVKLRHDAQSRAIAGISSGGICAFTVAWERPDAFSKVLSWVGSFTGIASGKTLKEGGNNYPVMIRKSPKKPIRIFLQDGANDLDNANGNWPLSAQQMAAAFAFSGYDYKFVFGQGFHSNNQGRAIMPSSLRWLWRDYKPQ